MLALFAERVRPKPRSLPNETLQALDALVTRRRRLIQMLTAEKNRLGFARPPINQGISQHISWLERQLGELDRELGKTIQSSPLWRAKDNLLRSVPRVGPVLSRTLIAELPELGALNREQTPPWPG